MADSSSPKKSGKGTFIVSVAVLTVLAVIGGGLVGKIVAAKAPLVETAAAKPAPPKPPVYAPTTEVRDLAPILVNLANPSDKLVRLQIAMVYAKDGVENPNLLGAQIDQDIVAYMQTLDLAQLQGASGLQALREDLTERANVRSNGKVREIILEALVIQ